MLTPVSFRKGRDSAPRLSAPYSPGKRADRFWRDEEIAVVRDNYAQYGAAWCLARLPGRTLPGVYQRARTLGLLAAGSPTTRRKIGTSCDDAIRERWPFLSGRGAVAALAAELGIPRHTVSGRAAALGLALPHKKEPTWTAAEDALLARAPVNDLKRASAFFAAHGFQRTSISIRVRSQRHGVSRRRRDVLSATKAAAILGVDNKTLATWCGEGSLRATRRGTERLPQQGGDTWSIRPADLRSFVVEQLERLDIRKVDKHLFVALLVGLLDPAPDEAAPGETPV